MQIVAVKGAVACLYQEGAITGIMYRYQNIHGPVPRWTYKWEG